MMSDFDTGSSGSSSGLSHAQQRAIVLVAQACAALSFMGSAVIVVANFRFKQVGLPLFGGYVHLSFVFFRTRAFFLEDVSSE